jgi:hypothetical protein
MLMDVAARARAVDGDALDIEHIAVEEQIGDGVLVIQFVVRVGIEDDADLRPAVGSGWPIDRREPGT